MNKDALSFLTFRAIRCVICNAENGDLPLFTRTLGLPLDQYQAMMAHYVPEYSVANEDPPLSYELLQTIIPDDFPRVLEKILSLRSGKDDQPKALWLAHAIASAAYGEQTLWENMGLANAVQLQILLTEYFPQWSLQRFGITRWQADLLKSG